MPGLSCLRKFEGTKNTSTRDAVEVYNYNYKYIHTLSNWNLSIFMFHATLRQIGPSVEEVSRLTDGMVIRAP